ncbi:MAG TPA: DUF6263 family protein [Fimbriimonadaceae bacterium]|nr:DUF6263 family protein [Fimbriimonadaceae bacterium]
MLNVLIAASLLGAAPFDAWDIHAPYKQDSTLDYEVVMTLHNGPEQNNVDMLIHHATTKKSDSGYEGTYGWTELYVDDQPQLDQTFGVTLKANGVLKAVTSDYGDGMRRMFLPFMFVYPDKRVDVGDTWTYKDAAEDEMDGHKATIVFKVVDTDTIKEKKVLKIESHLTEDGPDPMKSDGTFWVAEDGTVLKYKFKVTEWPVPVAQQVFQDADVTATLQ